VWAALGTAIVSIVGITVFGETYNLAKLIGLAMIISGVVIVEAHG
jgi:multidrug transporter EmrE-like cation transporter